MKLLLIALMGCCVTKAEDEVDSIREGNTQFAHDISKLLTESYENALFSPIGAHTVLSMLYQGAGGTTKGALAATLHVPDPTQTAQAYETILNDLNSDNAQIELSIASKIYVKPGHTLKPKFRDMLINHFSSEVQTLDFSQKVEVAKEINYWVELKTNNKIHDFVQVGDFDVDTQMVLLNAFYFKGNWLNVFDKEATVDGKFYVNETSVVQVPMMSTIAQFSYKKDVEFGAEIVALPFDNTNYSMFIMLPLEKYGVNELMSKLKIGDNNMVKGLKMLDINLIMPRFKLTKTSDMEKLLEELGLSELFNPSKCDLTNMFNDGEDVHIAKAVQKTYISVNEFGCEASAVSGISGAERSLPFYDVTVSLDHPFLMVLAHTTPNKPADILLMGRVINPAVNEI